MEFIDALGIVAGLFTSSSMIPQIVRSYKTKKTQDVSVCMFIVLLIGNVLWIYYGVDKSDIAITLTNVLSLGLNITMLTLEYLYRNNK